MTRQRILVIRSVNSTPMPGVDALVESDSYAITVAERQRVDDAFLDALQPTLIIIEVAFPTQTAQTPDGAAISGEGTPHLIITHDFDRQMPEPTPRKPVTVLPGSASPAELDAAIRRMLSDRDDIRAPDRPVLDALLFHAGDAVIALDSNQNLLYCNQLAHTLFHIDPQAVIEHLPVRQAVDNPELIDVLCRRVAGESHFRSEIHLAAQALTLNIQITDLDTVGRLAVMQDITYLKELDRIKSEFVERVSRDIRSPLTTILGYVELLDRTGEMNDTQRKFIERIVFGVQSITSLLSDLLDLSRIEADFKADQEPTQLTMIVRYAVEGNRQHFEARQQTLTSEIPDRLPLVLGNPLRLRQMVDHLLDNANKYTPPGGNVQVNLDQQGDFLVLTVQDDGIGIPAPDQAHVFEQFFRGSNVKEAGHKGSGLGLTIVKTIVDKHNGRVWLDSSEGAGTAFTVMLPTTSDQEPDRPAQPTP